MPRAEDRGGRRESLARLFDTPRLARVVPHLPAETLHQLVRYRGLDASGDLLAAATREQLSSLLDLDLWHRARPASDEQFDPDRFGEWLETLVETGEPVAVRIVSGIDERLVAAGLSAYIRVFDPATRAGGLRTDDEADAEEGGLAADVGGYLIRARRPDAWDAIVSLLLALDAGHRDYFHAVMRLCRRLSNSTREEDGLDDLLMEPEQLLHDLAMARESRRTQQGYLAPADARAWLQLARQRAVGSWGAPSVLHAIAADYLRADKDTPAAGGRGGAAPGPAAGSRPAPEVEESIDAVVELLAQAGVVPERPRALLLEGPASGPSPVEHLRTLFASLRDGDESAYLARSRELAFLANALMAGCSVDARPFTIEEATDAAVATCNLGLEGWQADPPHDLIDVFQRGWATLHAMSRSAAGRLVSVLEDLRCVDVETQQGLDVLRRELVKGCEAGTPWRVRDALDVIAVLDVPAWVSLLGVLGECPVLPAALPAILERRTRAVSATAFEFISTSSQIGEVRAFMAALVDILLRP